MSKPSKDFLQEHMDRYGERLGRDHDQLRAELMDSLPDRPDQVSSPKSGIRALLFGGKARIPRRLLKLAAMLAIVSTSLGLLLWMQSGRATAGVVFAEVLRQIREACSVRYKSTLKLGDSQPRTSEIIYKHPGFERKTMPGGQLQISDYNRGVLFYVEPQIKWTLTTEYPPDKQGTFKDDPLQRLINLPTEAGKLIGEEELDGQLVSVFEVSDKADKIKIWADSHTGLPLKIQIVSEPNGNQNVRDDIEAVLTLYDFVWNEPLDDALFHMEKPEDYKHYHIKLIDRSLPVEEKDLVEALRIFSDLSDGAFPDSLFAKDLKAILKKLEQPSVATLNEGTGMTLLAGNSEPVRKGVAPPMVRFLRANQQRMQLSRGMQFVNQLIAKKIPWQYRGKGVRRGQRKPVFQYRTNRSTRTSRIILGDLSTVTHVPKPRQQGPTQSKKKTPQKGNPK